MSAQAPAPYPPRVRFRRLDDGERARRLAEAIGAIDDRDDAWVFAYGSLMWNPAFEPSEQVAAHLAGHRRRFCFWTCTSRGSREAPGLGLGIEPAAGGCAGIAQRLDPTRIDQQMAALWRREMGSGVYRARWLEVRTGDGRCLRVLGFVADPQHPQFVPELDAETAAHAIARARGRYGRCRDYLAEVVRHTRALGAPEHELERLLREVDARA